MSRFDITKTAEAVLKEKIGVQEYYSVEVDGVELKAYGASGYGESKQAVEEVVKRYNAYPELVELARSIKAIIDDSQGVQGWHLNNALASWDELITEEEYDLLTKLEGKG